ncbi:ABC transporter ATP-binding protein [Sphingomonas sp.]|uniref:ABC transporter ATP-binding protein n=1 Tax=Sphingomonas sp. TaxID=28214 RepID=UPI0035BBD232
MVVIDLRDVSVRLGGRTVVDGVSATLDRGLIGILGPNGAGKSTLVRAAFGLVPATGAIAIEGDSVARTVAYLPQGGAIHWPLSVRRLVALGRLPHVAPLARMGWGDEAAVARAMAAADVAHLAERDATTLSGGERARVLLARALAAEARALIADEPLAALDPAHALAVMALLRATAVGGTLVVAVLHDLALAARFCDRILLMDGGRLVADGPPVTVLTADRIAEVYGVTAWIGQVGGIATVIPLGVAPGR